MDFSLSYLKKIVILNSLKFLQNSPKELKNVKQEKESLIVQLSKSHVLMNLRSEKYHVA
jgi:hypothetical protein